MSSRVTLAMLVIFLAMFSACQIGGDEDLTGEIFFCEEYNRRTGEAVGVASQFEAGRLLYVVFSIDEPINSDRVTLKFFYLQEDQSAVLVETRMRAVRPGTDGMVWSTSIVFGYGNATFLVEVVDGDGRRLASSKIEIMETD